MKQLFRIFSFATISAIVLAGCSVTSHTEVAKGVDFSNYKTFAWANEGNVNGSDRSNNDIIDNNIKNSISEEMERKGWKETTSSPDMLLDYAVAVKKGMERVSDPVYSGPYPRYWHGRRGIYTMWYPSMLIGYHTYNVPFKEGELTVNMTDAKTNKLIWQGWSKGEINTTSLTTKEATAQVKSIFRKFEYRG
jgi:hypothetical protein